MNKYLTTRTSMIEYGRLRFIQEILFPLNLYLRLLLKIKEQNTSALQDVTIKFKTVKRRLSNGTPGIMFMQNGKI